VEEEEVGIDDFGEMALLELAVPLPRGEGRLDRRGSPFDRELLGDVELQRE
jgi:hypothetical protein